MAQPDEPSLFEIGFGPYITARFAPSSVLAPPVSTAPVITAPVNASPDNGGPVAAPVTTPVVRPEPPKGYYYNKGGKLKKFNPPMNQRREFGLRQVYITEHELGLIRPRTLSHRQEVFVKNPARVKTRIHCTTSEIQTINEYREQKGYRLINISEKRLNNQEFKDHVASAESRRKMVEELREKGESTRTKKALEKLHLVQTGGS